MRTSISELGIWLILWFSLSLFFGIYTGGHAWQIIPFLGAIYGLGAGAIYSIGSHLYRTKRGPVSILVASLVGLLASICTVPVLVALTVHLDAALLFAALTGPITGVVVNFIVPGSRRHETTS